MNKVRQEQFLEDVKEIINFFYNLTFLNQVLTVFLIYSVP